MNVIFNHQKTCSVCGAFIRPMICIDMDYDEKINGSIWRCEKCHIEFAAKDRTPLEHLELIRQKYTQYKEGAE